MKKIGLLLLIMALVLFLGVTILFIKGDIRLKKALSDLNNPTSSIVHDEDMGYRYKENNQFSWSVVLKDSLFGDKNVTIDSLQRRFCNQNYGSKYLILFGCSYTFGYGLSDSSAIPYIINENQNRFQVYNYSVPGYGTQQLYTLFHKKINSEIKEEDGVFLYFFLDHHVNRLVKDLFSIRFSHYSPLLKIEDDTLIVKGMYNEIHPIWTKMVLGMENSFIYNMISRIEANFFRNVENDYTTTAKVIKASEKAYMRQFSNNDFYVVVFPGESDKIVPYLEKEKVKYINLSKSVDLETIQGRQKDGYHPNEKGAKAVAEIILGVIDTL